MDNLVTLCLDQIDADRLALRRQIEESLARLEKETLISRSGDNYFFLTNEERDINKEIKAGRTVERRGGQAAGRDHLRRRAEGAAQAPLQRQQDGLRLQPPLRPATRSATRRTGRCWSRSSRRWPTTTRFYDKAKCILESATEGGYVLIRLGNDESLGRELRTYLQTEKYLSRKERRHPVRVDQAHPARLRRGQPATPRPADDAARRDAGRGRILRRRAAAQAQGDRRRWRSWTRPWSTSSRTRSTRWAT